MNEALLEFQECQERFDELNNVFQFLYNTIESVVDSIQNFLTSFFEFIVECCLSPKEFAIFKKTKKKRIKNKYRNIIYKRSGLRL